MRPALLYKYTWTDGRSPTFDYLLFYNLRCAVLQEIMFLCICLYKAKDSETDVYSLFMQN